ncbi:MAG: hypothetical protein IAF38_18190 [Bacteroidia bacterium]|nr:hypothetical protein [Bacteroidia bacterium]
MKKPEELYYTIRSLDSHELRYFRLFAKRHVAESDNSYLKLFDIILNDKEVDDKELKSVHKVKNLPRTKQYLLLLLHKALLQYHDNDSWAAQVKRYTRLTEIFLEKGEYQVAMENLERAEKIAKKFHLQPELLRLLDLKYQVRNRSGDTNLMSDYILIAKEEFESLKQLDEIVSARLSLESMKKVDKEKGASRVADKKDEYDEVLNEIDTELKDDSKNEDAVLLLKNARLFYFYNHSEHENFYKEIKGIMDIYSRSATLIKKDEYRYLVSLNNYLVCCVRTEREKEFGKYSLLFRDYKTNSHSLSHYISVRFASLSVYKIIQFKEYDKITKVLPYITNSLKQIPVKNNVILSSLYYSICICLLQIKNYPEALRWSNRIIAGTDFLFNNSVFRPAMLVNLIANYEIGETDVLISNIRSFERMLSKRKPEENYEFIFFREMKKINNSTQKEKVRTIFAGLKTALEAELKKNKQNDILYGFDLVNWVKEKSEAR